MASSAGALVFTLEALDDAAAACRLTESGRHAHARDGRHVRLAASGFVEARIVPATPRHEGGRAVPGWLPPARRGGSR